MVLADNKAVIINSFKQLSQERSVSADLIAALTKFTILLYISKRKEDRERYSDCEDIGALRWELYSKYSEENDLLPPTAAALKFHLLRSNYVALTWKQLSTSFDPELPPCTAEQGWHTEGSRITAVMTDELPAPAFSLELVSCGCKSSHCRKNNCSCRKNNLKCTEVCNCIGCENEDDRFVEVDEEGDD